MIAWSAVPVIMRKNLRLFLLLCLIGSFVAVGSAAASPAAWTRVTQGLDYQGFVLPGPVRAFVARMDRNEKNLILESGLAQGSVLGGTETVSQIAKRYDGAVNAWGGTWGGTNQVWVAINGSYFDMETGEPFGGIIQGAQYERKYDDLHGLSGLMFKQDRSVFVGGCVIHPGEDQRVINLSSGDWVLLDDINSPGRKGKLVLYTAAYGGLSPGGNNRVEIVIELTRPAGIFPPPAYAPGVVLDVRQGLGPTPIMFNQVVLSMRGPEKDRLLALFHRGDAIGISMEVTHYEPDCRTPDSASWTKIYASIAGNILFLKDGQVLETDNQGANLRNPRTAICYNDDYLFFVVVDGRSDGYSVGMTTGELGMFCKDKLQATWGVNLDGGGSSTMWVNGIVQNHPSDGHERPVANAIMMVAVQPKARSSEFSAGLQVQALTPTNVLLGPGTNYRAIASVDAGAQGVILTQPAGLNGLAAKGTNWWKVDFGGTVGWVDELDLERLPSSRSLESLQLLLDQLIGEN
ncbi:MAG: phosphodiester glycosidase family protein [Anaerolineales bacterium]